MPNPLRGEAVLEAGDKTYTLVMDINALCLAEEELGMSIDEILARYSGGTSATIVRALLWAALQVNHECSVEQTGQIMTEAGFVQSKTALEKAILVAMPPATPEQKKRTVKKKAGTG